MEATGKRWSKAESGINYCATASGSTGVADEAMLDRPLQKNTKSGKRRFVNPGEPKGRQ